MPAFPRWSEQPMFFAALAFSAGIVASRACPVPVAQWVILCGALAAGASCLLVRQRASALLIALATFIPLGGLCATLAQKAEIPPPDIHRFTTEAMEFKAYVTSVALSRVNEDGRELK